MTYIGLPFYESLTCELILNYYATANLWGFRAPVNPRFEGGIPDLMHGIQDFMKNVSTF